MTAEDGTTGLHGMKRDDEISLKREWETLSPDTEDSTAFSMVAMAIGPAAMRRSIPLLRRSVSLGFTNAGWLATRMWSSCWAQDCADPRGPWLLDAVLGTDCNWKGTSVDFEDIVILHPSFASLRRRGFDWMLSMLTAFLDEYERIGLSSSPRSVEYGEIMFMAALEWDGSGSSVPDAVRERMAAMRGGDPIAFGRAVAGNMGEVTTLGEPWDIRVLPNSNLYARWRRAVSDPGYDGPACVSTLDSMRRLDEDYEAGASFRLAAAGGIVSAVEFRGDADYSFITGWARTHEFLRMSDNDSIPLSDMLAAAAPDAATIVGALRVVDVLSLLLGVDPAHPNGNGDTPSSTAIAGDSNPVPSTIAPVIIGLLECGMPADMIIENPALRGDIAARISYEIG